MILRWHESLKIDIIKIDNASVDLLIEPVYYLSIDSTNTFWAYEHVS